MCIRKRLILLLLLVSTVPIITIFVNLLAYGDTQSTSPATPQKKPEIKIGRVVCGGHLSLAVAEIKYKKSLKTFELKTVQYRDWNEMIKDLISGEIEGTFILSPLAMELIRLGFPAKIVLKADRNGNSFVLSNKIKSISGLKTLETIIAVPHIYSQHHVLLHLLLKQNKVNLEKVTVISMPQRDMINSLRREEIDGFVVGEPEGNKSITLGVGWMAAISPQIWNDHMDHVFIATNRLVNNYPDQLQELINILVRAGRFIETMSANMVKMDLWKDLPHDPSVFIDLRFVEQAIENLSDNK